MPPRSEKPAAAPPAQDPPTPPPSSAPSAPPASRETPAAAPPEITEDNYEASLRAMLPASDADRPGALLFAEACVVYGINPADDCLPQEILGAPGARFVFYPGNPRALTPVPDRVKFVTAGGVKVVHPIDADFEEILRRWHRAFHQDPKTQEVIADPLPPDLALPREAVTGVPVKTEHRYPQGYLRRRALDAARRERG